MKDKILISTLVFLLTSFFSYVSFAQKFPSQQMRTASKLVRQGELKKAEKVLSELVKNESRNHQAWFLLGFVFHSQEKLKLAESAYKNSIEIGKNSDAIYNLAAVYARMGKIDKSLDWLEKFIKLRKITSFYLRKVDGDFRVLRNHPRFKKILETIKPNDSPCMNLKEARQLDFWVGAWNVLDNVGNGRPMGENLIEISANGCALLENWQGREGHRGRSLSSYNPVTKKWKQFFVGNNAFTVELVGEYKNNLMLLKGETFDLKGKKTKHILELHNLPNKTVRQVRKVSKNNGKTWQIVWDATYVRKKY